MVTSAQTQDNDQGLTSVNNCVGVCLKEKSELDRTDLK